MVSEIELKALKQIRNQQYYLLNADKVKAKSTEYYNNHREEKIQKMKENYYKRKLQNDELKEAIKIKNEAEFGSWAEFN